MVSALYFQLKGMQLSHLEDVRQREEEIEARYAGQMAYLKLHHKELIEDMQAKHNSEVCVCVQVRESMYFEEEVVRKNSCSYICCFYRLSA